MFTLGWIAREAASLACEVPPGSDTAAVSGKERTDIYNFRTKNLRGAYMSDMLQYMRIF